MREFYVKRKKNGLIHNIFVEKTKCWEAFSYRQRSIWNYSDILKHVAALQICKQKQYKQHILCMYCHNDNADST